MGMIMQHGLFGPGAKYTKFQDGGISVIDAANTVTKMALNDLRIPYDQFNRTRSILPKRATNRALNTPVLGEAVTFVLIKVLYDAANKDLDANYLNYRLGETGATMSMTELLIATAPSGTPVPTIYIDNPSERYNVTLEIFSCTKAYDVVPEGNEYAIYIKDLNYNDLRTVDEYTLGVYKADNVELFIPNETLLDIERAEDVLIVDDPGQGRIGLRFVTEADAKQAFSAINWMLKNPAANILSVDTPRDITAPIITWTSEVVETGDTLTASLRLPGDGPLTKHLFTAYLVASVADDRDGAITIQDSYVTLTNPMGGNLQNASSAGVVTYAVTPSDLAGNARPYAVVVTITPPDLTPPVIDYTSLVTLENDLLVASYGLDAGLELTLAQVVIDLVEGVSDEVDGVIDPQDMTVTAFAAGTSEPALETLTCPGEYRVEFTAVDAAGNDRVESVFVTLEQLDFPPDPTPEPPVIVLTDAVVDGAFVVSIGLGETFTQADALAWMVDSANDFLNQPIAEVTATFADDLAELVESGEYVVTFSVTDTFEQTATVDVTITLTVS